MARNNTSVNRTDMEILDGQQNTESTDNFFLENWKLARIFAIDRISIDAPCIFILQMFQLGHEVDELKKITKKYFRFYEFDFICVTWESKQSIPAETFSEQSMLDRKLKL